MSLSVLVALWVMLAPGFEKEENGWHKRGDISVSAVSILFICFKTVNIDFSSVTAMQCWTSGQLSKPATYITHDAI